MSYFVFDIETDADELLNEADIVYGGTDEQGRFYGEGPFTEVTQVRYAHKIKHPSAEQWAVRNDDIVSQAQAVTGKGALVSDATMTAAGWFPED